MEKKFNAIKENKEHLNKGELNSLVWGLVDEIASIEDDLLIRVHNEFNGSHWVSRIHVDEIYFGSNLSRLIKEAVDKKHLTSNKDKVPTLNFLKYFIYESILENIWNA